MPRNGRWSEARLDRFERRIERLAARISKTLPLPPEGKAERLALAENDVFYFCATYLPHYFDAPFGEMHRRLDAFVEESEKPALVVLPRGHGKTSFLTVAKTIHKLLFKTRRFAVIGSDTLSRAKNLADLVRLEFEFNERLKQDFGAQKTHAQWERDNFVLRNGAVLRALGQGSPWRGHNYQGARPDWVVVDDLEDLKNTRNAAIVERRIAWLRATVYPAVKDDGGRLLVAGNLFSVRCALARLAANRDGEYRFRALQMSAEEKGGAPAWPERFTKKMLADKKDFMGGAAYAAEYLNLPSDEGVLIKPDWIAWMKPEEAPTFEAKNVVSFLDPSPTGSESSDFKALVVLARHGKKNYVLWSWIRKASIGEMWDAQFSAYDTFNMFRVGMEKNMLHDFLRESVADAEAARGTRLPWIGVMHRDKKADRISKLSPAFERGEFVFLRAGDNEALMDQLVFFGAPGTHDDGPDALAGAYDLLARGERRIGVVYSGAEAAWA